MRKTMLAEIDRVLRVSTQHMPDLNEDLSVWHSGQGDAAGLLLTWVYAYEEDWWFPPEQAIPKWLLVCIAARKVYNCNWILLDPDADSLDEFPVYEHS